MDEIEKEIISLIDQDRSSYIFYKKGTTIKHNPSGPAVEWYTGSKEWYFNGKRHRLDGPAVDWKSDNKPFTKRIKLWYINGCDITDKIKQWAKERDIDLENLSDMDKSVITLEWSNYKSEF
jgi:hypothetical protein